MHIMNYTYIKYIENSSKKRSMRFYSHNQILNSDIVDMMSDIKR